MVIARWTAWCGVRNHPWAFTMMNIFSGLTFPWIYRKSPAAFRATVYSGVLVVVQHITLHFTHSSPGAWLRWSPLGGILLPRVGNINNYVTSPARRFRVNWRLVSGLGIHRLRLLGALPLLDCWCVFCAMVVTTALFRATVCWKAAPGRCSPIVYSWTLSL